MLYSFFEWLEASPLGVFVKDQAATFAIIEALHLLGLALLGGTVLAQDLRVIRMILSLKIQLLALHHCGGGGGAPSAGSLRRSPLGGDKTMCAGRLSIKRVSRKIGAW